MQRHPILILGQRRLHGRLDLLETLLDQLKLPELGIHLHLDLVFGHLHLLSDALHILQQRAYPVGLTVRSGAHQRLPRQPFLLLLPLPDLILELVI